MIYYNRYLFFIINQNKLLTKYNIINLEIKMQKIAITIFFMIPNNYQIYNKIMFHAVFHVYVME